MRSLSKVFPARLACACVFSACLAFGVVGCGGDSGPTNTAGDVPPEIKQSNKSMEDFVKNQQKK